MERKYVAPKAESINLKSNNMIAASTNVRSSSSESPSAMHERDNSNDWSNIWK